METQKTNRSKTVICIIIALFTMLTACPGTTAYSIDGIHSGPGNYSTDTPYNPSGNENILTAANLVGYTLTLKERRNKEEQIKDIEIGLKYSPDYGFDSPEGGQHINVLGKIFINNEDPRIGASFDKELLKERLGSLSCFDEKYITGPENPVLRYTENGYVIADEVKGNKVDKDILYRQAVNAIFNRETVLDLEAAGCYIKAQYTSNSMEVIKAKDTLDKYTSSRIIYTFGEHEEIIDGSIINKWLIIDGNYEVAFDEEAVKSYLNNLSSKYGKYFKLENFITSSGKALDIGSGISLMVDAGKEAQDLISAIKSGKSMTKEPAYIPAAYVEIDLTKQHLWFYKNGSLITQGDIVSGSLSSGMATPEGVYSINFKKRDAVLKGPGYAAPVNFWMPFNGGIGIHDATWRHAFGGDIYKYDGSHGCINCPYTLAETIFNNIDAGTPVICYK